MQEATMLYKMPGPHQFNDGGYDYIIVDAPDVDSNLEQGWFKTPAEAKAAHEFISAATAGAMKTAAPMDTQQANETLIDNSPATRAELEAKATELGLKFDGRTGDKKLGEMIEAKLKEQA